MYKDSKWVSAQAKTLQTKIKKLNRTKANGESYSFPSQSHLEKLLTQNKAIMELRDCDENGCVVVLNEGQYKINKQDIVNDYLR